MRIIWLKSAKNWALTLGAFIQKKKKVLSVKSVIIYCLIFQALYGSKSDDGDSGDGGTTYNHRTTVAPPGEEDPLLCSDPKVDAMFNSAEGHTYAFKGNFV